MKGPPQSVIWLLDDARIFGGGQLLALRLARHVRDRVPDRAVTIVCPPASRLAEVCAAESITTEAFVFPDPHPRSLARAPGALWRMRRLLRATRGDPVVVAWSARASAWSALAARGMHLETPVVHLLIEQDTARRRSARFVYRRFGRLVALGENTRRAYAAAMPGVPILRANNIAPDARPATASTGDGPARLGVLSRLRAGKGVLELIDELARTPAGGWSTLAIAGAVEDPAYADRVRARIEALGMADRVELLGHRDDVDGFLASIDVLIVPSVGNEGQPGVILEALSARRPVVVRDAVWSPDFEGLPVTRFSDAESLADAIGAAAGADFDERELRRRFGAGQLLDALLSAAAAG